MTSNERTKLWCRANPERRAEHSAKYYAAHKAQIAAYGKKYAKAHPGKAAARQAKYNALNPGLRKDRLFAEKRATPYWANRVFIADMYTLAALVTELTGEPYEVDHAIPLRGKTVSGLHVESNLQVIPMHDNRAKHNLYAVA
jgi:hypothetical protein